jgi:hypothetical protein
VRRAAVARAVAAMEEVALEAAAVVWEVVAAVMWVEAVTWEEAVVMVKAATVTVM